MDINHLVSHATLEKRNNFQTARVLAPEQSVSTRLCTKPSECCKPKGYDVSITDQPLSRSLGLHVMICTPMKRVATLKVNAIVCFVADGPSIWKVR
jgi:hypothetical protein